jgi:hypothetical protein
MLNNLTIKRNYNPIGSGKWPIKKNKMNGELIGKLFQIMSGVIDLLLRTQVIMITTRPKLTNEKESSLPGKINTNRNSIKVYLIKRKWMLGEVNCTSLKIPSGSTYQLILFLKDKETEKIFQRRTSMLKSTVLQTPWLTESTGTDLKSHSFQTAPKLHSHQLHLFTKDKEMEETSPKKTSMLRFTDLPTLWSTESTGIDLKSHLSQMDLKSLSLQLHLFTKDKETEETSPRRTSMPRFTDLPTPWSTELTGTDPKSLSSQTDLKLPSHNQPLSTKTPTLSAILPTKK